jgi:hypothetical protein
VTPPDLTTELATLTGHLVQAGWTPIALPEDLPEDLLDPDTAGLHLRQLVSPDHTVLLTATWTPLSRTTLLTGALPGTAQVGWNAESAGLPARILLAAALAAQRPPGPDPATALLERAGWTKTRADYGSGMSADTYADPGRTRVAQATFLTGPSRTEQGPWLIERPDLGAPVAEATVSASAPPTVITALALTD